MIRLIKLQKATKHTFRRARLAFKIAAAFARADPFCNFAAVTVVAFFTATGFLTGALPAIFLTGAFFGLPSFLAAGLTVFLAAGFLSPVFLAGAAFLSVGFAAFFSAGLVAGAFFSAGLAAFFSAGLLAGAVAGRFSAVFFAGSAFFAG